LFHALCRELLESTGRALKQTQTFSLQAYDTALCATAMLFDVHLAVPDSVLAAVCKEFERHPDRIPQKAKVKPKGEVEDRTGALTMLALYEQWVHSKYGEAFKGAKQWLEEESVYKDPTVCAWCGQEDNAERLLRCDFPDCPEAVHCFCLPTPLDAVPSSRFFCPKHDVDEHHSSDDFGEDAEKAEEHKKDSEEIEITGGGESPISNAEMSTADTDGYLGRQW
jgi:hypothetical protein